MLAAQRLDDTLSVSPQLEPSAMAEAAAAGFRSVVCNRPDFEGGTDQPTAAAMEAAARAAGLDFAYLPVAGNYQSPDEIAAFAALLQRLPAPVLAYCRSGARSAKLHAAARALG